MKDLVLPCGILAAMLILLCSAANSFGQASAIIPPTPNAMKMTEYYSQRPGMYTGTANVSIPLYTIDFDGWELPLTLNYNATGIRTNEEASEVGLGWSLNATGIISRTIKGGDDLFPGDAINGHDGYVYNSLPVTFSMGYDWSAPTNDLPDDSSYYAHLVNDYPDTEPDIFNYNFFGYSGSFVLSQKVATNDTIRIVKITEDATAISFHEANNTFTIITPDGYKGEFTIKEKSTSFSSSMPNGETDRMMCCGQENIDVLQYQNTSSTFRTTTSWYLSKITSPRGEQIMFNYDLNADGSSPYLSDSKAFAELKDNGSPQVCLQTIQEHVYLKNIVSDDIEVTFTMEDREDLRENTLFAPSTSGTNSPFPESESLKRFSGVQIAGKDAASTLNKTITFVQSYFNQQYQDPISNNNNENELQWLRSRLDRVTIDDQEYRFYYDRGANGVPNKLTTGIDHFGFYNGQDQVSLVLPPDPANGAFVGGSDNLADSTLLEYYKQKWDRRVDFSYGKAGLLTKVKYPTRGYTVFEYEPHSYMVSTSGYFLEKRSTTSVDGSNAAGGARIKSIKAFDSNGKLVRSRSYEYVLPSNESSGKLMTPLYNRYSKVIHDYQDEPWAIAFLRRTHSSIPGNSTAEGKLVGYSRVDEVVDGPGTEGYKNTYFFENRPNTVSIFNLIAVGYPNLNGQLMEVRNYDSNGKIVKQTINKDYFHAIDSVKAILYERVVSETEGPSKFLGYLTPYTIRRTFNTPYTVVTIFPDKEPTTYEDANGNLVYIGINRQSQTQFYYNKDWLLRYKGEVNSFGDSIITRYRHPGDYPSPSTAIQHMAAADVNMINPVIEEITYKNGTVLAASASRYNYDQANNKVNLAASYTYNPDKGAFVSPSDGSNFAGSYDLKTTFDSYDPSTGKLLQYTGSDGITHSFVWGYNKKLPVVHGTGIGYSQLLAAHNTASSNPSTYETTLRNDAAINGKQVTTYAFNPQVGVSKITDANSVKNSFEYDSYGRLVTVRNNEDKILSQNKYHFKTLPITRILTLSSTSINFGTFYDCLPRPSARTLTLSNLGEADIDVSPIVPPPGFSFSWTGGTIYAGTSIDVQVYFTGGIGSHSGSVSIQSNNDGGTLTATLTANYLATGTSPGIQLTPNPLLFTVAHSTQYIQITNTGNACFTLSGTSLLPDDLYLSVSLPPITLVPSQTTTMSVFLKTFDLSTSKSFTVSSNEFGTMATVNVDIQRIILTPSSTDITFTPFTSATATQTFTIENTGNTLLDIQNITGNNTHFSVSPTSFQLQPTDPAKTITVTYTPVDFSPQDVELTFTSNKTDGPANVTLHAQRTEDYRVEWNPTSQVVIKPTDHPNETYLTNTGNVPATIVGATAMNNADFTVTYLAYSGGVWVPVNPNTSPVVLGLGQSLEVSVTSNTFSNSATNSITVRDDRNNDHVLQLVKSPTP